MVPMANPRACNSVPHAPSLISAPFFSHSLNWLIPSLASRIHRFRQNHSRIIPAYTPSTSARARNSRKVEFNHLILPALQRSAARHSLVALQFVPFPRFLHIHDQNAVVELAALYRNRGLFLSPCFCSAADEKRQQKEEDSFLHTHPHMGSKRACTASILSSPCFRTGRFLSVTNDRVRRDRRHDWDR